MDCVEKESEVNCQHRECCNQLIRSGIGSGQRIMPGAGPPRLEAYVEKKKKNSPLFSSEITLRGLD